MARKSLPSEPPKKNDDERPDPQELSPRIHGSSDGLILRIAFELPDSAHLCWSDGEALHRWFFDSLQKSAPSLAQHLHSLTHKPFSISIGDDLSRSALRDAVMNGASRFLLHYFGPMPEAIQAHCRRRRVLIFPSRKVTILKAVSSITTFSHLLQSSGEPSQIRFQFTSPTTFRRQGQNLPLPFPDLVFHSLLQRWNTFSPLQVSPHLAENLSRILLSRYQIRTEMVPFSDYKIIGFVGNCTFSLPPTIPAPERRMLHALARFAEFAGVGYKTTMSLGSTLLL